jgi:hypothetical protein
VIDASVNCTAMVHLPGKRALFCIMKNAAATRCERSVPLRSNGVSYRLFRQRLRDAPSSTRRMPPSSPSIDEILRSHLVRHARCGMDCSMAPTGNSRGHANPRAVIRSLRLRELRGLLPRAARSVFLFEILRGRVDLRPTRASLQVHGYATHLHRFRVETLARSAALSAQKDSPRIAHFKAAQNEHRAGLRLQNVVDTGSSNAYI